MGFTDQTIELHEKLHELIPHRPPMVMIDSLVKAEGDRCETVFQIKADNIFVHDNHLPEAGLIENIAQTSAAGFGYQFVSKNEPIPVGFIGSVQKLKIFNLPKVGDCLKTVVSFTHSVMNISVVEGFVYNQDSIIAQCHMKLVLQD